MSSNAATKDARKEPTSNNPKSVGNEGFSEKEKEISVGEVPPGWTIMRPLRKIGKTVAGSSAKQNQGSNLKDNNDIKITETNSTAEGFGELEVLQEVRSDDELLGPGEEGQGRARAENANPADHSLQSNGGASHERNTTVGVEYKVYKRRWFGLVQLVLLNIIVSWDWLTFSSTSTTISQYYGVSQDSINWLSTAFLFAFVVVSPIVIYTLHRGGPKPSIVTASILLFVGNWIRYGATRAGPKGNFAGVMVGQILTGFAQPFVLAAPTRYSDLWFTNRGRVAATAVMSLSNPFGGALAQLIDPFWAVNPSDVPNMVLYVAIISSVASVPSFFIPAAPPTPCSASSAVPKQQILPSLRFLFTCPEFYMIVLPFTIYVALFNSISSLINQILAPYSFSQTQAGIAGALLIVVGLVTSAVTSPIIDRTKSYLFAIKLQIPLVALSFLAFTWAPQTRNIGAIYAILSILGGASFSLVPVGLEYVIELTHPVSPEITSTICWTGGQLLGGCVILISNALRAGGVSDGTADDGSTRPPGNMYRALILQTVLALVIVPLPLALGCCGRGIRMRRVEADKEAGATRDAESGGVIVP